MKLRVADIAWPNRTDIDFERRLDVAVLDGLVKQCVAAVTTSLKNPPLGYSELQAVHISWMFQAMGLTHVTIRQLLREEERTPACVDAPALARLQLEALYSVCLMVQDPSFVNLHVKSFWRGNYARFLLTREECKDLTRFGEYLNQTGVAILEVLRQSAGVTLDEKATVEFEELGTPLPAGMSEAKVGRFPQPMGVINKIVDANQKRMLMRLYPEYQRLCGFAHGSPQAWMFKIAFWERSPLRQWNSELQRRDLFEKEVADPALIHSVLSAVQGACEVAALYPADIELKRVVIEAWNLLSEIHLLGRAVWEIRARSLLGVLRP